ncbi:hypothetical protein TSAR_014758 [Trichomalopsis sarcophagae]|uniref:Uncharacterized protein n=1 Tax=Trichomalopsis sarcophagae TaxID=543379 RepID=A0A232FKG4_9HYME|nr:hypothetical protein TSAR_014758 [Trichomalopsis sarcophagae]
MYDDIRRCMIDTLLIFISLPLTPVVLNKLKPLNESRPHIFILKGEFLVDRDENFAKIYVFDVLTCSTSAFVVMAVDTMYVRDLHRTLHWPLRYRQV